MDTRRSFIRSLTLAGTSVPLLKDMLGQELGQKLEKITYFDGLTLPTDDFQEIKDSGLSGFIMDVSSVEQLKTTDGSIRYFRSFEACARSVTAMRRKLREINSPLFLATRGSQIGEAFHTGRTAVFFQLQGCEPIGEDLSRVDLFYELGVRILQITHHNNNPHGGGALEKTPTGLTRLGIGCVERMNQVGIVPDISHASDLTALDVLRTSRKPVILSHSAARTIVPNARCAPDEVIRKVGESGGVTGIFMMSFWLTTEPTPTVDSYLQQIRHVINVAGIDAAGIANDYSIAGQLDLAKTGNNNAEGVKSYFPWWDSIAREGIPGFEKRPEHVVIPELNNIRRMYTIHGALKQQGYRRGEIEKILGGNWARVLTQSLS
jgi:membrane dipeptidase